MSNFVTGTTTLGTPLAMDLSMTDGPLASDNEDCVHSWLQDTVETHQLLLDKTLLCRTSEEHMRLFA
jgi:hypothetical protein